MIAQIEEAAQFIRLRVDANPTLGIILGTGLGGLVEDINVSTIVNYEEIPHFPVSTVESHSGRLIFGELGGKRVIVMQGRFHYYEGYTMQEVTFPVRVMKHLGIEKLIISNAAGGLNSEFSVSDLMVLTDHINLQPDNPLRGVNNEALGPRFPDMSDAYDPDLIELSKSVSTNLDFSLRFGVYAAVSGPNLETPAEYEYLARIGADAVGMSTVPENIVARHMDLPCFAVSVITDMCVPGKIEKVTIEKVIAAAAKAEPNLRQLIGSLVRDIE